MRSGVSRIRGCFQLAVSRGGKGGGGMSLLPTFGPPGLCAEESDALGPPHLVLWHAPSSMLVASAIVKSVRPFVRDLIRYP